jgi:Xaa-Pro aminopeptidase
MIKTPLVLCVLAFPTADVPRPDESPTTDVKTLGRKGDGAPICGLGAAFHAGRRAELRRRVADGWMVFRGLPGPRGATAFHQDKQFWYLTGIESPNATLVMHARTGQEILFLPAHDARAERWDGELWDADDEWVRELTGFEDVRADDDLMGVLDELFEEGDRVWTSSHPTLALSGASDYAARHDSRQTADPLDGRPSRATALGQRLAEHFGVEIADCRDALIDMRWVKTPEEVAAMRRAARSGALAVAEGIRSTRPGLGEWELDALMSWIQIREGAVGPAYHAIVGSGANSCVLHYSANDRILKEREVVLVDYGPEVDHYTTDITRTWPSDGRFTERAAELYDAVLAAQNAAIAVVRPGATMKDVDDAAGAVLKARGLAGLMLHGTCHWIGMEVHDPGARDARSKPLVPGVAFTVEPGVYEPKTGIGIRIEDVVVVTADGCEILTRDVPVDREAMETLVRSPGVLDLIDGVRVDEAPAD